MTTLTRFVPLRTSFEEVAALQDRLNSIFSEIAQPGTESGSQKEEEQGRAHVGFMPAVDIYEDAQQVVLKLEVPGVKLEDLDIHIENQRLIVRGERRFSSETKAENFHRIERRFGSFGRSFTLPQTIDTESVSATAEDGVLTITLAKKAEAKPRQVKIAVGSGSAGNTISAQSDAQSSVQPGAQSGVPEEKQIEGSAV